MSMVCPQCKGAFEQSLQCPKCGVRLMYQPDPAGAGSDQRHAKWQQTPWGRILFGLILAVGLNYGLLQLGSASLRAVSADEEILVLEPMRALLLFTGLQAAALLICGILVGAGKRQALNYGSIVGIMSGVVAAAAVVSGVLAPLLRVYSKDLIEGGAPIRNGMLYGLPMLHAIFGGIGGLIGRNIWKPAGHRTLPLESLAHAFALPGAKTKIALASPPQAKPVHVWSGPIAWVRVTIGITVAVLGAVGTNQVIEMMRFVSGGEVAIRTQFQNQVTTGEIFSLSVILGGCIAGATKRNGLKQGICVGIGASLAMAANVFPVGPEGSLESAIITILSALILAPLGGWFGCQLLPPVVPRRRKRQIWD